MRTAATLVLLCFSMLDAGTSTVPPGSKCGVPKVWSPLVRALRVVGGAEATHGSHPWLVSLRKKNNHFCGGAIVTDSWIMTAAHCFSTPLRESLRGVRVVIGDFDQKVTDEEEQVFVIKNIFIHDKYHPTLPMNYDIALLELNQPIRFGKRVQPVCLPLPDDNTKPETSCIVGGWGKTKEKGRLSTTLHEVQLNLVDPAQCKHVLQTVKSAMLSPQRLNRPQPALTVLCAGPETGGRDACQGDSGGPLVCPAGSAGGHWVALGVTSWGKGCGRSWDSNFSLPPSRRGSPGVFTDVKLMLSWIKLLLRQAFNTFYSKVEPGCRVEMGFDHHFYSVYGPWTNLFEWKLDIKHSPWETEAKQSGRHLSRLCSVQDGPVTDSEGVIRIPAPQYRHYDNNELCVWSISVPPGYSILLEIEHLDLESASYCLYDRLTVSVGAQKPVGMLCGGVHPSQVFLNNSHHATVLFSSDVSVVGSGFSMKYRAIRGLTDPGCGTVILVQNETSIHSPKYPQHYSNDCIFTWVVYAPQGHIIKLNLTDFELEESSRCLYDSLVAFGDVAGTEEITVLCGGSVPPPVISYHSVMVLQFTTDSSVTHRGFSANIEFINQSDLYEGKQPCRHQFKGFIKGLSERQHNLTASREPQSGPRRLEQEAEDLDLSSEPTVHEELRTDDEDLSDESLGTD